MTGEERRQHPRFRFELDVTIEGAEGEDVRQAKSGDISMSGMFIFINPPIPKDAHVAMSVHDLVSDRQFTAKGEIKHILPGTGNGVQFAPLDDEAEETLKSLIDDCKEQQHLEEQREREEEELPAME